MPETKIDPNAAPVSADDLAGDATEPEQPVLKEAQKSGEATTRGTGIETAISQA
ncbi:MAG: hypothetical protein JO290_11950 [Sphingomonadaceae bacterium]|nr:hypothetical protein [Sphingomonadaceae bacterium]